MIKFIKILASSGQVFGKERVQIGIPPPNKQIAIDSINKHVHNQSKLNGYSLAEVLLVFSIIAGVLVGAWATYVMVRAESNVRAGLSEIHMLQDASVQFRQAPGNDNSYENMTYSALKPYLGDTNLAKASRNVYGSIIHFYADPPFSDVVWEYTVPDFNTCIGILGNFGKVTDNGDETAQIEPGDAIPGYVGSIHFDVMGCDVELLYIQVD